MMITKGEFLAEVQSGSLTASKGGTEQVLVEFRLLEGPDEGQRISDYLALTDAALPYTVPKLRTCGWKGEDISDLSGLPETKVRLVLVHEEYQGKTRARVRFINKVREVPQLDASARTSIADRLKAKIAAIEAQTATNEDGTPFNKF